MRFFKIQRVLPAADDCAAVERLIAVVGRGRAELPFYSIIEEPLTPPEQVQRRFWTPEELAQENSHG